MRLVAEAALAGEPVAWFAPTYRMLCEVWTGLSRLLLPHIVRAQSQNHRIELACGGFVDVWSLEVPDRIRGRKYQCVVIDEAAMVRGLGDCWQATIRPTLAESQGTAWLLSTPRGRNFFWKAFQLGRRPGANDWASWHRPSSSNPLVSPAELDAARRDLPERIFHQEYMAEFLDDAGGVFHGVERVVEGGRRVNQPPVPSASYTLGVDLARVHDFTVLCVLNNAGEQIYFDRFNQISWERQIHAIVEVARRYQAQVILDSTGVGDPIFERLRRMGISVHPFRFTSSSKERLIDNLAIRLEQGGLRLMDLEVQTQELLAFEYQESHGSLRRMGAPPGLHDDTVIGLALACWGLDSNQRVRVY